MPERRIGLVHEVFEFLRGDFLRGDVQRENGDGELLECVVFPFGLPVGWEGGDALGDVEAAVGCEAGEDGLWVSGLSGLCILGVRRERNDLFK